MSSTRRRNSVTTRKSSSASERTQDARPQRVPGSLAAKLRIPAAAALLLALAALPYAKSLDNGFVRDDHQQLVMNSALRPDSRFRRLFEPKIWGLNLLLNYWVKLLAPIHLNAYYIFSAVMPFHDLRAIAAMLFLIASTGGIPYRVRRAPMAAFAVGCASP